MRPTSSISVLNQEVPCYSSHQTFEEHYNGLTEENLDCIMEKYFAPCLLLYVIAGCFADGEFLEALQITLAFHICSAVFISFSVLLKCHKNRHGFFKIFLVVSVIGRKSDLYNVYTQISLYIYKFEANKRISLL